MADARAEQIIAAIVTALTGLTTTGSNVQRGQVYGHQAADLPALAITMGADVPVEEYQTDLIDWQLTVMVESTEYVNAAYTDFSSLIDQKLNQIRKEVHAAVMADHTLGLNFVIDIEPGPAGEPVLTGAGDMPIGTQLLEFVILYRTSRTDISA